jgi:hypothetical protein
MSFKKRNVCGKSFADLIEFSSEHNYDELAKLRFLTSLAMTSV